MSKFLLFLILGIVVATNPVWYDISCYLNGRMNGAAIHTFVYRGAHDIKDKLGLVPGQIDKLNKLMTEDGSPLDDDDGMLYKYSVLCSGVKLNFCRRGK